MKKTIAILSILLFSNALVIAQLGNPIAHDIGVTTNYLKMKNTFRTESHLSYIRNINRHALYFSAIFTLLTDHAETQSYLPRPTGLGFDYSYNIPCVLDVLDMNFSAGLSYRLIYNTWSGNYYSEEQAYIPVNTSSLEHLMDFRMGYGFKLWVGDHFYFGPNLQGGVYHSKLNSGRNITNKDVDIQEPEHDFRRYGDVGWLMQANFIVGFRF